MPSMEAALAGILVGDPEIDDVGREAFGDEVEALKDFRCWTNMYARICEYIDESV